MKKRAFYRKPVFSYLSFWFHGPPVVQGMSDGQLVGVIEFVPESDASGDGREGNARTGGQAPGEVKRGGLPLDRSAQSQNDLLDFAACDIFEQQVDFQIRGADTLHR